MSRYQLPESLASSSRELQRAAGISDRVARRWAADGLTWQEADRLAVLLKKHPLEIWPDWDMPFMAWQRVHALDESWSLRDLPRVERRPAKPARVRRKVAA